MTGHAEQDSYDLVSFFPQWMQDTLTAAVDAGKFTTGDAEAGGLLFYGRVLAPTAGSKPGEDESMDLDLIVPDPAGHPGALAAFRALLARLPGDDLARFTAETMRPVPAGEAEAAVAAQYASGDAWIVASGDQEALTVSVMRLGGLPGTACWFDDGTGRVITCTGETAATRGVLAWTIPALSGGLLPDPDQGPRGGVLSIPKDVPAATLNAGLGEQAGSGESSDLILLASPNFTTAWPEFLVRAIESSDPGTAARLLAQ